MRIALLLAGVAFASAGLSFQAEAACNVRGEHCGRPGWAANAFSARADRVPEDWLDNPTNPPAYGHVDRDQVKKRYRKQQRTYR